MNYSIVLLWSVDMKMWRCVSFSIQNIPECEKKIKFE